MDVVSVRKKKLSFQKNQSNLKTKYGTTTNLITKNS